MCNVRLLKKHLITTCPIVF